MPELWSASLCVNKEKRVNDDSDAVVRRVRLHIYRSFVEKSRASTPLELSAAFGLSPEAVGRILRYLESEVSAIVLLPDSPYIWMAEPFSAVPTLFPVKSGDREWFGNCIWDALAILALLERDGEIETLSPLDGKPLRFVVREGSLEPPSEAVIHFAVPASEWWKSIGFT